MVSAGGERQQHFTSLSSRLHHGPLGAPDGLSCSHHRYDYWKSLPEALSAGSRERRHNQISLQVPNILILLSQRFFNGLPSAWTIFLCTGMSGLFQCAGWRMEMWVETSGGWWRKKVFGSSLLLQWNFPPPPHPPNVLKKDFLCFVLAVNLDMRSGSSWVLANINVTGYYRVNYDLGNWERLLAQLSSDHQVTSGLLWVSWDAFSPCTLSNNALCLDSGHTCDQQSAAAGRCLQLGQVGLCCSSLPCQCPGVTTSSFLI